MKLPTFVISGFVLMSIISCTNNTEKENAEINISTNDSITSDNNDTENEKEFLLPSAGQIAVIFKRAQLKYIPGVCTEIKNDNVGGEFEYALRLGIYSADLFYNLLNNQWGESEKYFLKSKNMADKLGFKEVFSEDILNRLKKNIHNTDSVVKGLSTIQYNIDSKVQMENKEYITHVAFASAWIESIKIALEVYKKENSKNIPSLIAEQITIGNSLVQLLKKDVTKENKINELINIINALMNDFNNLQSVKQNVDSDFIELSKEEFDTLSKSIETAHKNIINL